MKMQLLCGLDKFSNKRNGILVPNKDTEDERFERIRLQGVKVFL